MNAAKRFQLTFTILSIGYIAMGVLRILYPEPEQTFISLILGGIALLAGLVRIAFYFMSDLTSRAFRNDLAIGGVLLIAGIYAIVKPDQLSHWLPVILGFCIVFDSILKLEFSFGLKRMQFNSWWIIAVVALITSIMGILLLVASFEGPFLIYYMGVVLVFDGLANLLSLILFGGSLKKYAKAGGKKALKDANKQKEESDSTKDETNTESISTENKTSNGWEQFEEPEFVIPEVPEQTASPEPSTKDESNNNN